MKKTKKRLYLFTDINAVKVLIEKSFRSFNFLTRTSSDMNNMINEIGEFGPDIILVDVDINNFNCDKVCNEFNKIESINDIPVILLVHSENTDTIEPHLIDCIYDYVYKPIDSNELYSRIRMALSTKEKINQMLKEERGNYVKATATTMHHEINQFLSVILLSSELLETQLSSNIGKKEKKYLKKIKNGVNSITDVMFRLNLVADDEFKPEIIDYSDDSIMLKLPTSDYKNKVLIVDDIDEVRTSIIEILKNEGVKTLSAATLNDAEKIIKEEHQNISTVFCDLKMGKKSGLELYHTLQKINKDVHFVIITGYPMLKETKKIIRDLNIHVIHKPFTRRRILKALMLQNAK